MKTKIFYWLLIFFVNVIFLLLPGCVSVEQTIYLGDVEVNAPITPPPTHVVINKKPGDVTVSFKAAIHTDRKKIIASTDHNFEGVIKMSDSSEYKSRTENLQWNISDYILGADIDIKIWKSVSVFGGIHFSAGKGNSLTGGNFGLGFHNHQKNPAVRFDIGLGIQKYDYKAVTIVETKTTTIYGNEKSTGYYLDKGNSVNINPLLTLTVNSANDSALINYYCTLGYFTQNLLGFEPGETHYSTPFVGSGTTVDERSDCTCGFLYLNPGLSYSFDLQMKIIFSIKILKELAVTDKSSNWFIMPSVQMDFQL